jgi:cysteine-rich repeat protein
MPKKKLTQLIVGLACLWLGCWLLPVFGQSARAIRGRSVISNVPTLGLSRSKAPPAGLISARDERFAAARSADGDSYDAVGIAQDATIAWLIDDLPDTHTFGAGPESAGVNLLSNIDTGIVGTDFGPGVPGTNFLQVNYFTTDGSDIVPAGSTSDDGLIFDSWRFDVGTTGAGVDKINWTPNPGFTVVDSRFCLLDDGQLLGCLDLALHDSDANGVSGVGVAGLGGGDIAGFGVDEMVMYWEIQVAPSCGDGSVDTGEECDDGNTTGGDGCSATCQGETSASPADLDDDGDVDLDDHAIFISMFTGPR